MENKGYTLSETDLKNNYFAVIKIHLMNDRIYGNGNSVEAIETTLKKDGISYDPLEYDPTVDWEKVFNDIISYAEEDADFYRDENPDVTRELNGMISSMEFQVIVEPLVKSE